MRVPLSWLREYVDLPDPVNAKELADRLTMLALKLEKLHEVGVSGPLVVGRVLSQTPETHSNGKTVNWCRVDVGPQHNQPDPDGGPPGRGIVCGAHNFAPGDLVVVALPGVVLPGAFTIGARKTYGHVSDGMICSAAELELGSDHDGIIVLPPDTAQPGADASALLGLNDIVLELEVATDRGYALSIRGVARDTALAYDRQFRDPAEVAVTAAAGEAYPVRVEDTERCDRFVARTVSGFDPAAPTPWWMARRLQLAGMRSISLAVDVTNYVMLELGNPIHGYDRDRLVGPIVVRRAEPGETLRTLDGALRTLVADDLLITDDSGPIGLAGVMGGELTEITATTTSVVIEAAHFQARSTGRMARRHRLMSEGARRWDRGVDPQLAEVAAQRVANLLAEHGGARIDPGATVVGAPAAPAVITIDATLPARVTGIDVAPDSAVAAMRAVGCAVEETGSGLSVRPPSWRPDLTDPYDLVEEVARVIGYHRIPSVLPTAPPGRGLTTEQRLRRRVGHLLAGRGLTEVLAYPFVGEPDLDALGLAEHDTRRRAVRVANPISEREPLLHTTLAPALLKTLARNVGRGHADAALFLLAPVFWIGERDLPAAPLPPVERAPSVAERAALDAALPAQPIHLAVVLSGERDPAGWWGQSRQASWADAIETVRAVGRVLHVDVQVARAVHAPWHPGRCAELSVQGSSVGYAGELHPRVCEAFGVPPRSAYAEVDLEVLMAAAPPVVTAPKLSTMPVAKQDVALLVDKKVPAAEVEAALRAGAGALLEEIRLFDVYTGHPVPEGKKSLAFALRFRAPDRTLTEAEVTRARDAAVDRAVSECKAEPRS
ncbi:MAG: phenylalanine--tRNA ligase subunit beta [Actinomycetota bacterium]|nr:phenylalanine--tRNA ligase subunit beta [Actinomycetota bacterium]